MAVERKAICQPRESAIGRRRNLDKEAGWSVEFNIDSALRVTDAEVQALETWFGKQLDALFEDPCPSQDEIVMPNEATSPLMRKRG